MKGAVCCAILLLMCVFAHALENTCEYEGETLSVGTHTRRCLQITCHENGRMHLLGCALSRCQEGKQIGYQETDFNKPYPDCCERPICKDS